MAKGKAASPKPKPSPKGKAKSKSGSSKVTVKAKAKAGGKTGAKSDTKQKLLTFTTCPDMSSSPSLPSQPEPSISLPTMTTSTSSTSITSSSHSTHTVDKSPVDPGMGSSASASTLNRQDRLMYLQNEIDSLQKRREPASHRDQDVDLHWEDQCWGVFYDPDGL